jgi:hypothetical protein
MSHLFDVNKLIAKYPIGQPPDPNNREAEAILAGERTNTDNWLLCDPVRSPELYERISQVYHNFRKVKPERARELGQPEPFELDAREWRWEGDGCCINIADLCDGLLTDFPISFGGLTMVFKCCGNCRAKAAQDAETGLALGAIVAYDRRERPDPRERRT